MKVLILLLSIFHLVLALDESKQLQSIHPLQNTFQSNKLLCEMQTDIQTYLYETPISTYTFFNAKSAHLGDYRYDMFTLLSDLLLKMQADSDFSGSKEKAILGSFIDGYFERLKDEKLSCPCIEEALSDVKEHDLLYQYTKVKDKKRSFNTHMQTLSKVDPVQQAVIRKETLAYLFKFNLMAIKDIVIDEYGDYLLLSEGKSTKQDDDIIFSLSANTVPVSYQVDLQMKTMYLEKSLIDKNKVIASFNKNHYAEIITIGTQEYFINKLNPRLDLKPQSEKTNAYKNYAAALGFMLASFHSNSKLVSCKEFAKKARQQVQQRLLKTEILTMVYAYNEALEEKWEEFNAQKLSACN